MYDLFKNFIYTDPDTGKKVIKAIFCDLSECLIQHGEPDLVLSKILKDSNLPVFLTSLVPDGFSSCRLYKIPYRINIGPILPSDNISYLTDGATVAIVIDNDSTNYMSIYNPEPNKGDFYEKLSKAIEFVKQDKYKEHLYTNEEKHTEKKYLKNLFTPRFDYTRMESTFGGKAQKLHYLANNAYKKDTYDKVYFAIPYGFALSTHVFDLLYGKAYSEIKHILSKLEKYDFNGIKSASNKIQNIMKDCQKNGIPKWLNTHILYSYDNIHDEISSSDKVIVRSSADVEDGGRFSYAGLFKSIPNVNKSNLIDAVFEVHCSLYSAPAIQYALINGIRDFGKMGVLVQEQIDSVASAIAFTNSPIPEYNQHYDIVINDGFGEELMSGKVKGNRFIVDKSTDKVIHEQLSYLSKKHYEYVKSITPILHNLENLNNFTQPLDCEFAIKQCKDGSLTPFLVQCRPQTTTNTEYKRTKDEIIGKLRKDDSDIIRKGDILLTDNILKKNLYKYDIAEAIILWSKDPKGITDLSISHAEIILREILVKNNTPLLIKPEIEHSDTFKYWKWVRIDLKTNKIFPHIPKEKTR